MDFVGYISLPSKHPYSFVICIEKEKEKCINRLLNKEYFIFIFYRCSN